MINLIPARRIESKIYMIRGEKVMLDKDLAELYGVKTFVLNQAVRRNIGRFPEDFMFRLTMEEFKSLISYYDPSYLKSQSVMSKRGGRRTRPYAFTEQGIAMLSSVLKSERAIQVNIAIMRAFVRLKKIISSHKELAQKFAQLEQKVEKHDTEIEGIFDAIRKLIAPSEKAKKRIGFLGGKQGGG
jgi:hypothetical protein